MNMDEQNSWCFACGKSNPIGLKLSFYEQDDCYFSDFIAAKEHQGYDGIVHGGIVSTLLDEIMARYIYAKGLKAVTAELRVRYHKPTPIAEKLSLKGYITKQNKRFYEMASELKLADGTLCASATAKIIVI